MGKRSSKYCRTSGRGQGTTAGKKFCRNPHYCRKLNSKYCKSSGRGRYSSYCKINRKKGFNPSQKVQMVAPCMCGPFLALPHFAMQAQRQTKHENNPQTGSV